MFLVAPASLPAHVELAKMKEYLNSLSNLNPVSTQKVRKGNLPHWEFPGNAYFITISTIPEYTLYACVVMPTNVHVILLPIEETQGNYYSLSQIMHSIKSFTTNKLQKGLSINGKIWLDEGYDRIIRDDNDFYVKMNYIINNPVKAGLTEYPENYKWLFYRGI